MCGRLRKALYGTRDAAQNWEYAYVDFLIEQGVASGLATPCIFYKVRDLRIVGNGDDFAVLGSNSQLDWFRQCISHRFEVKFRGRSGPSPGNQGSIRIVNRVVQWTNDGISYEADQRHAEIIVQ